MWDPPSAMLFVVGPAEARCDYLNVFTDQDQVNAWSQAHPHVASEVVTPGTAELLGRNIFGDLLDSLG